MRGYDATSFTGKYFIYLLFISIFISNIETRGSRLGMMVDWIAILELWKVKKTNYKFVQNYMKLRFLLQKLMSEHLMPSRGSFFIFRRLDILTNGPDNFLIILPENTCTPQSGRVECHLETAGGSVVRYKLSPSQGGGGGLRSNMSEMHGIQDSNSPRGISE